jgi:hypothetical protein
MAIQHYGWFRWPEAWSAPDADPTTQFRSLVSHLFDRYPVPPFMMRAWFSDDFYDRFHDWVINLYLHLAHGRSVRQFPLPDVYRLTKSAAVWFMQAPADLHPRDALRWAWIRSLGADDRLARLLIRHTLLGNTQWRQAAWEPTIRFLMAHQPIDVDEMAAMIQFVEDQKFQPAEHIWGPGAGPTPLQPDFTLHGRTLISIRRHMVNWRADLLRRRDSLPSVMCTVWQPAPIGSFEYHDGVRRWSIDELRTADELKREGAALQHCVAEYAWVCAGRKTSIWSMKVDRGDEPRRVLTIEVSPVSRTIVQAKGKRNAPPTHRVAEVLQRWIKQEGLQTPQA